MTNSVQTKTQKLNSEHKNRSVWQRIVTILAAIVVFITTYALILPAITWERQLICELDEHTHDASCYQEVTVPASSTITCGCEEHTHTDECYISELICGLEESEGHVHSESCYDTEGGIICGLEESAGHTHTEACWQKTLSCTKQEHTHSADCVTVVPEHVEKKLICGKEEHKHDESCFDAPPAYDDGYYCGIVAHKHSVEQGCYYEDGVTLKCTLAEHEHVLQCQSDPKADVEDAYDWESELAGIELSGNWSKDVLTIAKSQLGYRESEKNYQVTENDELKGYTRYGAKYGNPYGDWCAMFCSFCLDYAGVTEFPTNANCQAWIESLKNLEIEKNQTLAESEEPYVLYEEAAIAAPNPGDLVFFDENADKVADHIALVTEITEATEEKAAKLLTIEGNWGNVVCEVERDLDDSTILGYGYLPENPNAPEFSYEISYEGDDYKVVVNYSKESNIPENATVEARELEQGSEEYLSYYNQLVENDGSVNVLFCRLFDITIMADGVEIEPDATVNVNIIYKDAINESGTSACAETYHFTDEGTVECLPTELEKDEDGNDVFAYTQSSFSVVANLLAQSTPVTGTYFQRVSTIDSTTADYIIVSVNGNVALVAGNAGATSVNGTYVDLVPVKGNPGYYTISTDEANMRWRFNTTITGTTGNAQIRRGTNGVYIYQTRAGSRNNYTYPLFSTTAGNEALTYIPASGTWTIQGTATNATTRYVYTNGTTRAVTSATTNDMGRNYVILKRLTNTTLEIPDDPQGGQTPGGGDTPDLGVQPTYPKDEKTTISGSKTGDADISDIVPGAPEGTTVSYKSDPSTSKIEDYFDSVKTSTFDPSINDGKVMFDKSVIYGKDDYGAFNNYDDGIFSVSLSTMAQTYKLRTEDTVKVPVDVIFILDVSGSMENNNAGSVTRTAAVVNAVNAAMDKIMTDNAENRAGIVMYSSGGNVLLPIRHYGVGTNGQYVDYSNGDIYTSTGLNYKQGNRTQTVTRTNGEANGFTQGHGTYTQYGIALGYQELEKITDTTYTATLYEGTDYEKDVTVKRQPVIILLSDGDPTHCTSNYTNVLAGPAYGSGVYTNTTNNRGVQGYYTILSANYYKRMAGIHYDNPATFYTIGMGIYDDVNNYNDMSTQSATGDDYKRAVLKPTSDNINRYLNTSSKNYTRSGQWLKQMLGNTYPDEYAQVDTVTSYAQAIGNTAAYVPILENPYSDYDYADEARFGNLNADDLEEFFSHVIDSNLKINSYGFMLFRGSDASFNDTIGEGMEIKGNPVLRFNGVNYPTVKTGPFYEGGEKYYKYSVNRTVYTTDGSGTNGKQRSFDLSKIDITQYEETLDDGTVQQTIAMNIPEELLPSLIPPDGFPATGPEWYYEMLPARLIYQVGLTDAAKTEVANLPAGQEKTFYTNAVDIEDDLVYPTTNAHQNPHEDNPYYYGNETRDPVYPKGGTQEIEKTENTTGTYGDSYSSIEYVDSYTNPEGELTDVLSLDIALGNNGTLTFTAPEPQTVDLVLVKVDMAGDPITSTPATFAVYTNADLANNHLFGTYTTDNVNGSLTITGLTPDTTYWLKETRAPDGHSLMTEVKQFSVSADGTVTGFDPSDTYLYVEDGKLMVRNPTGFVLPATGGNGIYVIITVGALLLAGALITCYVLRQRRDRRANQ